VEVLFLQGQKSQNREDCRSETEEIAGLQSGEGIEAEGGRKVSESN